VIDGLIAAQISRKHGPSVEISPRRPRPARASRPSPPASQRSCGPV
jgi:hypothetical protein